MIKNVRMHYQHIKNMSKIYVIVHQIIYYLLKVAILKKLKMKYF